MEITLLAQSDCEHCHHAQDVLERLAADYPIHITSVDIATPDGAQLAEATGVLFPPGVLVDGDPFSYGRLSERKLRRELDRRLHARSS